MDEYRGKYERKPADPDGLMDEELLGLGVRYEDRTAEDAGYAATAPAAEAARKTGKQKHNLPAMAALVAADGLLIFMCLADKIELGYGLVALAWASAYLGGRANRARL